MWQGGQDPELQWKIANRIGGRVDNTEEIINMIGKMGNYHIMWRNEVLRILQKSLANSLPSGDTSGAKERAKHRKKGKKRPRQRKKK